jgi:hypothetical protein
MATQGKEEKITFQSRSLYTGQKLITIQQGQKNTIWKLTFGWLKVTESEGISGVPRTARA